MFKQKFDCENCKNSMDAETEEPVKEIACYVCAGTMTKVED